MAATCAITIQIDSRNGQLLQHSFFFSVRKTHWTIKYEPIKERAGVIAFWTPLCPSILCDDSQDLKLKIFFPEVHVQI
jgi:hypothetical protein